MELPDSNSPHKGGEGSDAGGDYLKAEGGDKCQGQDKACLIRELFSSPSFSHIFSDCAPIEQCCSMS